MYQLPSSLNYYRQVWNVLGDPVYSIYVEFKISETLEIRVTYNLRD